MPRDPCKHQGSNVLLVEGPNDCHVILALCNAYDVPETFGINACGDKDKVIRTLNALISEPSGDKAVGHSVIGAVLDADTNLEGRWTSIRAKLRDYPYNLPDSPEQLGTIVEAELLPKLGIWLMPNNQTTGILEDFCLEMIDENGQQAARSAVSTAHSTGVCTFKPAHLSKAIVHTYLAWQDQPGRPLGLSMTAHTLRPETDTAKAFAAWLTRLFAA